MSPASARARAADGGLELEFEGEPTPVTTARLAARTGGAAADRRPELRTRLWPNGSERDARRDHAWSTTPLQRHRGRPAPVADAVLHRTGLPFLTGVPRASARSYEACGKMGRVAETNYGLLFEVRSVAQPENPRLSDHGLACHTDKSVSRAGAGLQALHVLVSSPDGGENLFADGFAIAEQCARRNPGLLDPDQHARAISIPLGGRGSLRGAAPDPAQRRRPDRAIHYNNRSIAPLSPVGADLALLTPRTAASPACCASRASDATTLGDGELVVFDNQRTCTGAPRSHRSADPRHLQGCY